MTITSDISLSFLLMLEDAEILTKHPTSSPFAKRGRYFSLTASLPKASTSR